MGEVSFCFTKRRLHFGSGLRGKAEVIFHFSKLLLHLERVIFRFRGGLLYLLAPLFHFWTRLLHIWRALFPVRRVLFHGTTPLSGKVAESYEKGALKYLKVAAEGEVAAQKDEVKTPIDVKGP